jgi:hypothetical protein
MPSGKISRKTRRNRLSTRAARNSHWLGTSCGDTVLRASIAVKRRTSLLTRARSTPHTGSTNGAEKCGQRSEGDEKPLRLRSPAARVFLHPHPRTRDDVGEIVPGAPSQHSLSLRRIGHQNRRIARPTRSHRSPNRPSSGFFRRLDDFENGMSAARPQIGGQRVAPSFKVLQGSHVRIGKIIHMNVVADAGPIRGRVVGAVDL